MPAQKAMFQLGWVSQSLVLTDQCAQKQLKKIGMKRMAHYVANLRCFRLTIFAYLLNPLALIRVSSQVFCICMMLHGLKSQPLINKPWLVNCGGSPKQ